MEEIKEMISIYNNYLYIILFSVGAAVVITVIVAQFTRRISIIKYIPGLVSLLIGMFLLIRILPDAYLKENLGTLALGMIGTGAGIIGLSVAVILDLMTVKKRKNKKQEISYEDY